MITEQMTNNILDLSYKKYDSEFLYNEICSFSTDDINFIYLGKYPYNPIWDLQQKIHESVKKLKLGNVVLLLEHDHVYTFGKNANQDFLLNSYPKDVEVIHSDRGGQVTYHGPGQLIGYPILNLNDFTKSVTWYMRSLEDVIISTLRDCNIIGNRKDGMTGVWVEDEKICAMGVRLSKWVTMHGFALNLKPNMSYYDSMIPCGIQEYGITSISELQTEEYSLMDLSNMITENFIKTFKGLSEEI